MKRLVLTKLHRAGFDIFRAQPNLVDFLTSRNIEIVLDVGANAGQFGRWLRHRGYDGRIISLEPIAALYARLRHEARDDKLWETHQIAAGESPGSLEINISDVSQFSSFLEQTCVAQRLFDSSRPSTTESVQMTTLDQFTSDLRGNIFLKVDTQGYEETVLRGSQQLLQRLCGVQLELPIIHLYRGTWTLTRAIEYMKERGFIIGQLAPVSFAPGDGTCLVEVDATFRRFDKSIDGGD
jgi:FkbM family methyltransferase